MGLAYSDDREESAFGVIIDGDGEVTDYLRLPHITKRRNDFRLTAVERELKEKDIDNLREFLSTKKPHVIVIGADSRYSIWVLNSYDIKIIH